MNTLKIKELYEKVQIQKAAIDAANKNNYVTDWIFKFGNSGQVVDIKTERSIPKLIDILGFLYNISASNKAASEKLLGIDPNYKFTWLGATIEQWESDLSTRVTQLTMANKKAALKAAEETLLQFDPSILETIKLEAIETLLK